MERLYWFGGICFTINGNMCCGVHEDRLMLRLGEEKTAEALERPHARPFDFSGKPMKSMLIVDAPGYRTDAALKSWIQEAVSHVATLPPKKKSAKKSPASTKPQIGLIVPRDTMDRLYHPNTTVFVCAPLSGLFRFCPALPHANLVSHE